MQRHLGALSVRVQLSAGATEAEIDDAIADAIVRALGREGKLLKKPALTLLPPPCLPKGAIVGIDPFNPLASVILFHTTWRRSGHASVQVVWEGSADCVMRMCRSGTKRWNLPKNYDFRILTNSSYERLACRSIR